MYKTFPKRKREWSSARSTILTTECTISCHLGTAAADNFSHLHNVDGGVRVSRELSPFFVTPTVSA